MVEKITKLQSPIEMMMLMHEAFRAQSERTEQLASDTQDGRDLGAFTESFNFWVKQLLYHTNAEDVHMTAPLTDSQPARDNEAEHADLAKQGTEIIEFMEKGDAAGLADTVKTAMLAVDEEQHKELVEKVQEVEEMLRREIGQSRVLARTRRHLYGRVMALRILEFDHFENEEAFVVPLVRERMNERQQLEVAKRLLLDENAEDPRWIIDWVARELKPGDRKLLTELEARFN